MSQIKTYRELDTWQVGMTVVDQTYSLTRPLPDDERFGLTSQMRRAAVSIPSNVAESHGRRLYRLRREKERQLAVPLTSIVFFVALTATSLFS